MVCGYGKAIEFYTRKLRFGRLEGAGHVLAYLELEDDLRRRLTVGRPVSAAPVERVPEGEG